MPAKEGNPSSGIRPRPNQALHGAPRRSVSWQLPFQADMSGMCMSVRAATFGHSAMNVGSSIVSWGFRNCDPHVSACPAPLS